MATISRVYLDYAATTPVDPRVLEAMLPFYSQDFGNPASVHQHGQRAEAAIERARARVAETLNCQPKEILFTACGSESDNLALRGAAFSADRGRGAGHILISPVEHHAVSQTAFDLAHRFGFEVELLPIDTYGQVSLQDVAERIRADTAVVSVIYANNEIGTLNPIAEIGALCRDRGVLFHTDAVQAGAHLPLDVQALQVDLMALGAHKFYGPKGVGALFVRAGVDLEPVQTGGGQELGLRPGTHNVPSIVGFAEALRLAQEERHDRSARLQPMRDRIIGETLENIPDALLTGHPVIRLPNHASFVFRGVDGNALLRMLDVAGFACSSASACKTGSPEPSEVLTAVGFTPDWALGSLRVTLGSQTQSEEIEAFRQTLPRIVARARKLPA